MLDEVCLGHSIFTKHPIFSYVVAVEVETNIAVPVTTDKGLCGGINSSVSKYARGTLKAFAEGVLLH